MLLWDHVEFHINGLNQHAVGVTVLHSNGDTGNGFYFWVSSDITFIAEFDVIKYDVTAYINQPSWGSVEGLGRYLPSEEVVLTAKPNAGYEFSYWYYQYEQYFEPTLSFVMGEQNCRVSAYFERIKYNVDGIYYYIDGETKTAIVTQYAGEDGNYSGNIVIPETITVDGENYTVTEIESYAFEYSGIQSVVIPATVTKIGYQAFYDCDALISVEFSEGFKGVDDAGRSVVAGVVVGKQSNIDCKWPGKVDTVKSGVEIGTAFEDRFALKTADSFPLQNLYIRGVKMRFHIFDDLPCSAGSKHFRSLTEKSFPACLIKSKYQIFPCCRVVNIFNTSFPYFFKNGPIISVSRKSFMALAIASALSVLPIIIPPLIILF